MVVDSSALVAIAFREPEARSFRHTIDRAVDPLLSVVSLVESSMVVFGRNGESGLTRLAEIMRDGGVRCMGVDELQAAAAVSAWRTFGKGNSPARLNFGDCFSYALARTHDRPLLFKGGDFLRTDVAVM